MSDRRCRIGLVASKEVGIGRDEDEDEEGIDDVGGEGVDDDEDEEAVVAAIGCRCSGLAAAVAAAISAPAVHARKITAATSSRQFCDAIRSRRRMAKDPLIFSR